MPFGIGWTLFVYLSRKEASMRWQLYTVSRGVVFAFLLMPTFFVAGHGGLPTNTIAGLAATLIFGRPGIGAGGLTFGVAGGPLVYLAPCLLGLVVYAVIFAIDFVVHRRFNEQ